VWSTSPATDIPLHRDVGRNTAKYFSNGCARSRNSLPTRSVSRRGAIQMSTTTGTCCGTQVVGKLAPRAPKRASSFRRRVRP
jgi:hypothetical protein